MTTIFGAVRWHRDDPGAAADVATLGRELAHRRGDTKVQRFGRAVLAIHDHGAVLGVSAGLGVAADIRLDGATTGTVSSVAAAVRRPHGELGKRLAGDVAAAVWNEPASELLLVRDVFGVRPLYYASNPAGVAFASEAAALLALDWVDDTLDDERLAAFLAAGHHPGDRTYHLGVRRVPPRAALRIMPAGSSVATTWSPDLRTTWRAKSDREYEEAYRDALTTAVVERMGRGEVVGAHLSGGLDSSAIAVLAARALRAGGRRLAVVSFDAAPGGDGLTAREAPFVDAVAEAEPDVEVHRILPDDGWPLADLPALRDLPSSMGAGAQQGAELARFESLGVTDVLTGWGGDHCATNAPGWHADQLLHGRLGLLWRDSRARSTGRGLSLATARKAAAGIVDLDLAQRLHLPQPHLHGRRSADALLDRWTNREWAATSGLTALLSGREGRRKRSVRATQLHRLVELGSVTRRTEACDRFGATAGLTYGHPFLDLRLVELCLSLPPEQLVRDGVSRSLHRRAMRGVLPELVRTRPGKLPTDRARLLRLLAERDALVDLVDRSRGNTAITSRLDLDAIVVDLQALPVGALDQPATWPRLRDELAATAAALPSVVVTLSFLAAQTASDGRSPVAHVRESGALPA